MTYQINDKRSVVTTFIKNHIYGCQHPAITERRRELLFNYNMRNRFPTANIVSHFLRMANTVWFCAGECSGMELVRAIDHRLIDHYCDRSLQGRYALLEVYKGVCDIVYIQLRNVFGQYHIRVYKFKVIINVVCSLASSNSSPGRC
jgi:hypothetical protein